MKNKLEYRIENGSLIIDNYFNDLKIASINGGSVENILKKCKLYDEEYETFLKENEYMKHIAKDFERLELTDLQQEVRQAVARLPEDKAEVIDLHFLQGVSYQSISNQKGCSQQLIAEKGRKGLQLLRQDKSLRLSYADMQQHRKGKDWIFESAERMWKYSPEYLTAKAQLDERRAKGEYISYGTEQTLLAAQRTRYIENYIRERQSNSVYA